jgi:hypothetical protein
MVLREKGEARKQIKEEVVPEKTPLKNETG